jgi:hypothetical protein
MGRNSLGVVVAVGALAGCGGEAERVATTAPATTTRTKAAEPVRCTIARAPGFRLCAHAFGTAPNVPATIQRRRGDGWRVLVAGPPRTVHDGVQVGHWAQAWLSPDGRTLLAQWSAECEVPIAFFVDAKTGEMHPVTGEKVWTEAPESIALGWGADGRAWVRMTKGYCGGAKHPPGVYSIDPASGKLSLVKREEARG